MVLIQSVALGFAPSEANSELKKDLGPIFVTKFTALRAGSLAGVLLSVSIVASFVRLGKP